MKKVISFTLALLLLMASQAGGVTAASCATQHIVKTGENLFRIGLKYGVDWRIIAQANNLANPNLIYVAQVLCIPAATVTATPTPAPTSTPARTGTPAPTVTPAPTSTPVPALPPGVIPTFIIVGVAADQTVTIQTANFPAGQKFEVRMGAMGTRGVNGIVVGTTDSGNGGAFRATYNIPATLKGARQIAIRLQSPSGYFSYNWFFNTTTTP